MKMNDLSELRKMWRKESIICDRYAACYIDGDGAVRIQESRPLLLETEGRFGKHMALIKKMLSGDLENRILQADFVPGPYGQPDRLVPESLISSRTDRLRGLETLEQFFEDIRDSLAECREHVILVYHGVYDIPGIGTDQGESEEVYEHLLCLVCPTKRAKQNLAVEGNLLYMTAGDRLISAPECGFIWPAFDSRTENVDAAVIYNADAGDPAHGFFDRLRLEDFRTTEEIRRGMKEIFHEAVRDQEEAEKYLVMTAEKMGQLGPEDGLAESTLEKLLHQAGVPEKYIADILEGYQSRLRPYRPKVYQLMDPAVNMEIAAGKQGERMRSLLLRAAGVIGDVAGADSELVRELLTAADLQK